MIGRHAEQETLRTAERSPRAEFIAIYGRRRIGKTFLVRETFGDRLAFSHAGVETVGMGEQLRAFQSSLKEAGWRGTRRPRNWFDAFDALKEVLKGNKAAKKIVFLDELPWMDTPKSDFVPALEFFWNGWASARKDILLLVCGSATSWILSKVLKSRGGLHNRVTGQIWLQPFTLAECEAYAGELGLSMSRMDLAEAYMALGGIPYYWSFLKPGLGLAQNMDALFFAPDAKLRLEFRQLYASLFKHPEPHLKIVHALGTKGAGLSREELAVACGFPESGKLSRCIEELEQCGFVRRYRPFGGRKKGYLCQLVDGFTLFHFRFVQGNPQLDPHFGSASYAGSVHRVWAGLAFERLCLLHLDAIKRALGISGIVSGACAWRGGAIGGKGSQIDLLIDRDDRVINLCEMKYRDGLYAVDKDDDAKLRNKREVFSRETGTRKAVHLTLVTTHGLAETPYRCVFQSVVTLDDLFR